MRVRLGRLVLVAFPFAVSAAFCARALSGQGIYIARDIFRAYYPTKAYWAERVSRGEFPLWYPFDGLGESFAAITVNGPFHPMNFLFLVLSLGTAMTLTIALCFPVACGGAMALARQARLSTAPVMLAGVVYAFNGYTASMTNNLPYLQALATLPWVWWSARRLFLAPSMGRLLLLSLGSALVLFAGDVQGFVLSQAGVALIAALDEGPRRRRLTWLALAAAGSAGVAAAQWVPSLAVRSLTRFSQQTFESAVGFSTHPLRLFELALGPLFSFGAGQVADVEIARSLLDTEGGTSWSASIFVGLPTVVLVFGALWWRRRHRWTLPLAASGALVLTLMLGAATPVAGWFFRFVPLWASFRYPEKLTPLLMLLLSLAAAVGLQIVLRRKAARRQAQSGLVAAALVAALLGGLELNGVLSGAVITAGFPLASATVGALRDRFLVASGAAALFGLIVAAGLIGPRSRRLASLVGVGLPLFIAHEPLQELSSGTAIEQAGPLLRALATLEPSPSLGAFRVTSFVESFGVPTFDGVSFVEARALTLSAGLASGSTGLWGLENASPYLPAVPKDLFDVGLGAELVGLYNVKYGVFSAEAWARIPGDSRLVVARATPLSPILVKTPFFFPRAFVAAPLCVESAAAATVALKTRAFRAREEALVECAERSADFGGVRAAGSRLTGFGAGTVTITHYDFEAVSLEARLTSPSVVVLNDAWYPGWTALVDGAPQPIVRANGLVRGVLLPAGTHHIEFEYHDPAAALGGRITGLSVVLLLLGVLTERRELPFALGYGARAPTPGEGRRLRSSRTEPVGLAGGARRTRGQVAVVAVGPAEPRRHAAGIRRCAHIARAAGRLTAPGRWAGRAAGAARLAEDGLGHAHAAGARRLASAAGGDAVAPGEASVEAEL